MNDIPTSSEAILVCGDGRKRGWLCGLQPVAVFKFDIDRVARGKSGPAGIGHVLRNSKGKVLLMFSKDVGVNESNEAKVMVILEALWFFLLPLQS